MSRRPIARSPDLKRLQDEEFNIDVIEGNLVMRDVPYLNAQGEVKRGALVGPLKLADDVTIGMEDHTVMWAGEYPCDQAGKRMERIVIEEFPGVGKDIGGGVVVKYRFSAKMRHADPNSWIPYPDFYAKMVAYDRILSGPAKLVQPNVTARTAPLIPDDESNPIFKYADTATSRAGLEAVSLKLHVEKIAIVGLGGTGSYVLDLMAKVPVRQLHLFDGDKLIQHNAFRSPGAPSGGELGPLPYKVDYFAAIYSKMRYGVIPHAEYMTPEGVDQLAQFDFVFLCMEGPTKRAIVERLLELKVGFIDVGMGLQLRNGALTGQIRITTVTPERQDHVVRRIRFAETDARNEYDANIQIADLNALNAALAVIRWKRLRGFYADLGNELYAVYGVTVNDILNEDKAA